MNALSGRTVLVTGVSGFIGAAAARRLREAGAVVHGVFHRTAPPPDICDRVWPLDLTDMLALRRVLDAVQPDVIFHLAAQVAGARDLHRVLPMLHANLVASVNLLVAASERRGTRVVLAGSLEEPPPDGAWPVPTSPYAAAKLAAGAYARMCHALYGTRVVLLRLFMVYGPGQPDLRKLIPYVALSLLRGQAPQLTRGARPVDWVYVDDVVEALLAAAVAEGSQIEGRTLDVGSGTLVTVREVVERIGRLVDPGLALRFGALPERPLEQVRVADVATTAAWLGWRAQTSLDEGLRRTVDWYRDQAARAHESGCRAMSSSSF